MKVCFVVHDITAIGGIERITVDLANKLLEENKEIFIISYFRTNKEINYKINEKIEIKFVTNKKTQGKSGSVRRGLQYIFSFFTINKFFLKNKFDYIVAQGMPVAVILFFLNFMKRKIITCEHVNCYYYNGIVRYVRNILYKFYFKIIVLTDKDKEYFARKIKNIECIPNFISNISEKKSNLNNKVLISVGRLEEQKGYDILIDICSKFLFRYPEWKLKIFGKGTLKEELQIQIEKHNLENQILLMGTTSKIEEEYLKSDIYIMSSRFEGFPMVLLEAENYGLPMISFNCPNGPDSIIENNINGFLIENFNKEEMQQKIEFLMENEKMRIKMGINSKNKVKMFSSENILKKWNEILK